MKVEAWFLECDDSSPEEEWCFDNFCIYIPELQYFFFDDLEVMGGKPWFHCKKSLWTYLGEI